MLTTGFILLVVGAALAFFGSAITEYGGTGLAIAVIVLSIVLLLASVYCFHQNAMMV